MGLRHFDISRELTNLLKVVAAMLVMFAHYFNIKASMGAELNPVEWLVRSQGGNIGVAIFFFLSGYGLMMSEIKSHLSFRLYFRRRFLKVYLPVVLVTAIWLPIAYNILLGVGENGGGITLILSDLLFNFKDSVLWFIKSLIILYAAFFIFSWLRHHNRVSAALVSLAILTVLTCIISYYCNGAFGLNSMSGIPLFSVGVISALYNNRFYKCFNIAFAPLIISFILLSAVFLCHPRFIANIGHSIADYAVVGTMILVFSRCNPSLKFPAVLGAITFDVYLTHFKILEVFKAFDSDLSIAAFVASTAVASIVFYYLRTQLLKLII